MPRERRPGEGEGDQPALSATGERPIPTADEQRRALWKQIAEFEKEHGAFIPKKAPVMASMTETGVPLFKFKVIAGSHVDNMGKRSMPGDVFSCTAELDKMWPRKFQRVG
jgi:hypothetical protein